MSNEARVLEGTVVFQSLFETDVYNGQDTGKYTLTLALNDSDAERLSGMGVNIKNYEGTAQRKFSSKFPVMVVDAADEVVRGGVPYGSKVRILWKTGAPHPTHGTSTYMKRVRVLEFAESDESIPEEF